MIKVEIIDGAIVRTKGDLSILREKQSKEANFKARAVKPLVSLLIKVCH